MPYLEMGWAVVNVSYRLARISLAPAAVEDCRCALRWVISKAKDYNLDVNKLVVTGNSAGGHLAACMLATDWPAFDASLPENLVVAAYAISGLFDLGPLVETSINTALRLDQERVGSVLGSRGDIVFGAHTKVEPDVFVVPPEEMATLDWKQIRHLLLIAEVLSPSSRRFDRFTKRVEFQRQGIPLYWVADGEQEQVEEWSPSAEVPVVRRDRLVWHPVGALVPFELELAWLFRAP